MPDDADAQILQVVRRQIRQDRVVYLVLAERSLILSKAKAPQPDHDVHDGPELRRAVYHRWRAAENMAPSLMPVLGDPSLAGDEGRRNRLDLPQWRTVPGAKRWLSKSSQGK